VNLVARFEVLGFEKTDNSVVVEFLDAGRDKEQRRAAALALAGALHPRLGAGSPAKGLSQDLLGHIIHLNTWTLPTAQTVGPMMLFPVAANTGANSASMFGHKVSSLFELYFPTYAGLAALFKQKLVSIRPVIANELRFDSDNLGRCFIDATHGPFDRSSPKGKLALVCLFAAAVELAGSVFEPFVYMIRAECVEKYVYTRRQNANLDLTWEVEVMALELLSPCLGWTRNSAARKAKHNRILDLACAIASTCQRNWERESALLDQWRKFDSQGRAAFKKFITATNATMTRIQTGLKLTDGNWGPATFGRRDIISMLSYCASQRKHVIVNSKFFKTIREDIHQLTGLAAPEYNRAHAYVNNRAEEYAAQARAQVQIPMRIIGLFKCKTF